MTPERKSELFNNMLCHIIELVGSCNAFDTFTAIGFTYDEMIEYNIPISSEDIIADYRKEVCVPFIRKFLQRIGKNNISEATKQELEDEQILATNEAIKEKSSIDTCYYAEFIDNEIAKREIAGKVLNKDRKQIYEFEVLENV